MLKFCKDLSAFWYIELFCHHDQRMATATSTTFL